MLRRKLQFDQGADPFGTSGHCWVTHPDLILTLLLITYYFNFLVSVYKLNNINQISQGG